MTQIFGDFSDELPDSQEHLTLIFSPSSVPLQQRWRTNGLSADFMVDYFATFFPGKESSTPEIDPQAEVKSAISFIANELMENAMKFTDETSQQPISIALQMHRDKLVFLATNNVSSQTAEKFRAYIRELTTSNPGELYVRQLGTSVEDETHSTSGMGLLTMMNDYLAKIGWKFETVQKESKIITVTTMVRLIV